MCWLVVDLPLWKIWVRQLGWFSIPNIWKNKIHVPNHQAVLECQPQTILDPLTCQGSIHFDSVAPKTRKKKLWGWETHEHPSKSLIPWNTACFFSGFPVFGSFLISNILLVGGWFSSLPLWKMMDFVSWEGWHAIYEMESHKIPWFQTTHQIYCYSNYFINHY